MELPDEIFSRLASFYDEGELVIREPKSTDTIYHLGISTRQDQYVLVPGKSLPQSMFNDDTYYEHAQNAYFELFNIIPLEFTNQGEIVGKVNVGFIDNSGSETNEITFESPVVASFIQYFFDEQGIDICIYCPDRY